MNKSGCLWPEMICGAAEIRVEHVQVRILIDVVGVGLDQLAPVAPVCSFINVDL